MWGECEQAMHYSIDCYVAKAILPASEVSYHSTQAIHAWHVAKTRFVTLLSKVSWLHRKAFQKHEHATTESFVLAARSYTLVVAVIG